MLLAMALSLAAGVMVRPAKPAAHGEAALWNPSQAERVMLALKKLFSPGGS
jgi:hypothetical protein